MFEDQQPTKQPLDKDKIFEQEAINFLPEKKNKWGGFWHKKKPVNSSIDKQPKMHVPSTSAKPADRPEDFSLLKHSIKVDKKTEDKTKIEPFSQFKKIFSRFFKHTTSSNLNDKLKAPVGKKASNLSKQERKKQSASVSNVASAKVINSTNEIKTSQEKTAGLGQKIPQSAEVKPALADKNKQSKPLPIERFLGKAASAPEQPAKTLKNHPKTSIKQFGLQSKMAQKEIGLHNVAVDDSVDDENDLDVNLLPQQKKYPNQKTALTGYAVALLMVLMISFLPYYYYYKKNKQVKIALAETQMQIDKVKLKGKQLKQQVLAMKPFSQKLTVLLNLLHHHIYWSKFFPLLENYTLGNVYYTDLTVNNDGAVILKGKAHTLRDFAEQYVVLKNNTAFQNLELNTLNFVEPKTVNDAKIEFSISYNINKALILPQLDNKEGSKANKKNNSQVDSEQP